MTDDKELEAVVALGCLRGAGGGLLSLLADAEISASQFLDMDIAMRAGVSSEAAIDWSPAEIADARATACREVEFCAAHCIRILSPLTEGYPRRALGAPDAPSTLFALGEGDLNALHAIGVVGTRRITPSGDSFTRRFVKELGELVHRPLIVSGLAYGTDAAAHEAALDNELPTVAVLAHGFSTLYPAAHRQLANRIVASGGVLLTQYLSYEKPFRGHFLQRNRVIAAISDGVMVVESAVKGGAMNTAHAAADYDRAVMAMPGRPSDPMSEGCNRLIRHNIASLTCDALQACHTMNWSVADAKAAGQKEEAPSLFREPEGELLPVYRIISDAETPVGVDTIVMRCGLPPSRAAAMLYSLEEEGFIRRLPNNRYSL